MNPFDHVNSVSYNKKHTMRGTENDVEAEKSYDPFLTNRSLSNYPDTVMYANEINMYPDLPKIMQYEYYLHILRPKNRFSKWTKKDKNEDIELIMKVFGYNVSKARSALSLLTPDQLSEIRTKMKVEYE